MKILFRASEAGALMTKTRGSLFTEKDQEKIDELEWEKKHGVNKNGNKVKFEGTLKPKQLAELYEKKNAPIELSDTAKSMIKRAWLKNEKGISKSLKNKYVEKGMMAEEDSITLLSEVENQIFIKNEERKENDFFTGECDIVKQQENRKLIIDIKSSWDAETFMNASPSLIYEIQGQVYMELFDADEFELCFCLVDTPQHLIESEKYNIKKKYYSVDMTDAELDLLEKHLEPLYEQIERNMIFSTNPKITKEERVKKFHFYRDKKLYSELVEMAKLGQEYYKTLSLNTKK